jgi:hypothetical protein
MADVSLAELLESRLERANLIFTSLDFGYTVEDADGWTCRNETVSRVLYFEGEDGGPTVKGSLEITFDPGSATVRAGLSLDHKGTLLVDYEKVSGRELYPWSG